MTRRTARLALAIPVLVALAACVVNLSFDMDQSGLALQVPLAGSVTEQIFPVDLGNYSDVRNHQKDIRSLDLEYLDLTITEIKPANAAQTVSLSVAMRRTLNDPPSMDVKVGDLQSFPVVLNSTRRMPGNAALDAFLLERLHEGGKFYLVMNGSTDGKTDLVLDVNLHSSMGYETGLF